MRLKRLFLFLIISLVIGCSSNPKVKLSKKWLPLEYVVQSKYQDEDSYAAWDKCMYVSNLKDWKNKNKVHKHTSLLHERVHIIRQEEEGLLSFCWKYFLDTEFRKKEEILAYAVEIRYLLKKGRYINTGYYIRTLSGDLYNNMMSKEEAKEWLIKILNLKSNLKIPKKYWVNDD